ncbi:hypothetical protein K1T71_014706 [Dendrolimus kikuchii]|nr:hypothetical protein K1T71_014908 [Dendrolimus kikuchii]KAJ0169521.1 hypothetical protein K1T71_014706 [Dendrolimus kikuchii]
MTEIAKFDLERVISNDREESVSSLFPLLTRISPTSIQHQQELDDEWRKLPFYHKDLDLSQPPDVFWHQFDHKAKHKYLSKSEKKVKFSDNKQNEHLRSHEVKPNMLKSQTFTHKSMSPNPSNGEDNNYVSIFTHESSPQSSPERNLSIQKPTENVNVNYPTSSQKSNKNDLDSDSFESVESNQSIKSPIFVNVHENESSDDSICEYDSQDLSELKQFEQKIISQTSPTEMHKIDDNLPDNIGKNDVIKINDEAYNAERDIISEGKYSSRGRFLRKTKKLNL